MVSDPFEPLQVPRETPLRIESSNGKGLGSSPCRIPRFIDGRVEHEPLLAQQFDSGPLFPFGAQVLMYILLGCDEVMRNYIVTVENVPCASASSRAFTW